MPQEDTFALPDHVKVVLAAIANTLGNGLLAPERLSLVAEEFRDCLDGHKVWPEHRPRSAKGPKPRLKAVYTIVVTGPKIDGRWHFSPGQFDDLLRKAIEADTLCGRMMKQSARFGTALTRTAEGLDLAISV